MILRDAQWLKPVYDFLVQISFRIKRSPGKSIYADVRIEIRFFACRRKRKTMGFMDNEPNIFISRHYFERLTQCDMHCFHKSCFLFLGILATHFN